MMKLLLWTCTVVLSTLAVDCTVYKDCGSRDTITSMTVTDCDTPPCVCVYPKNYAITIAFDAKVAATNLTDQITAVVGGTPIKLPPLDACSRLVKGSCPIVPGNSYVFNMSAPIESEFPALDNVLVTTALIDENKVVHACTEIVVRVVK